MDDVKPPFSAAMDVRKYVFVEPKAKVEIMKLLEDLKKFNEVLPALSDEFEAHLILLDREISSVIDLNRSMSAKRTLTRCIQNFYDLRDSIPELTKFGITLDLINNLFSDCTLLVEFLYFKNYKLFCTDILQRAAKMKETVIAETVKLEILESLINIFFPLKETGDQISKQMKHLSLFFHADRVPSDMKRDAHEMYLLLTDLKEKVLMDLQNPSLSDEKRLEELEQKAKGAHEVAVHFNRALRIKLGKLSSAGASPDLILLSQRPEIELLEKRRLHATRACSFYRSGIQIIDKLARSNTDYVELQIKYRDHIAASFHLGGYKIEAQIYLISAIHLATDLLNASEIILRLNDRLKQVAGGSSAQSISVPQSAVFPPTPPKNTFSEMSNSLVIAAKCTGTVTTESQRKALKNEVKKATQNFLIENTVRADTRLAEYQAPTNSISQARNTAMIYTISGALSITGGTLAVAALSAFAVSVSVAEGVVLPVAVTLVAATGFPGLIVSGIFLVAFGCTLFLSGLKMGKKPQRQKLLNEIMTEAIRKYEIGAFEEMFEALSRDFLGHTLLEFKKKVKISVDADQIIDKLLDHGFRCDGIGLILHIISEGLICSNLSLEERQGKDWMRSKALDIIVALEKSRKLDDDAKRLDQLVFESKTKILNQTFQKYLLDCRGVPASYVKDAKVAPFKSRLEEVRVIASINKVILYILRDENTWAIENVAKLKNSINEHFQYFTISVYRVEALEDFLSARGLYQPEEPEVATKSTLQIVDVITKSNLLWGNIQTECLDEAILSNSTLQWFEFLAQLPNSRFRFNSNEAFLRHLESKRRKEEKNYQEKIAELSAKDGGKAQLPTPPILTSLSTFIKAVKIASLVTIEEIKKNFEHLREIFKMQFVICRKTDGTAHRLKYLYKLVHQQTDHINENWNLTYFICNDLSMVFQIYPQQDKSQFIAFKAAVALAHARELVEEANSNRSLNNISESLKCYEESSTYFLRALNCFDSKWTYLTFSTLYQYKEYQNLMEFTRKLQNKSYFPVRTWHNEEIEAILGLMECYCGTFKFSKALDLVAICLRREEMEKCHLFWYWYSVAARKSTYYYDSIFAIQRSLELNPAFPDAQREHKIAKNLGDKEITGTVQDYVNTYLNYDRRHFEIPPKHKFYDVISIDGGGVKGIIPAYWLAEIERRARYPIAELVQMLAGTSTGSVIAGALTVPSRSSPMPIAAKELVEMYTNKIQLQDVFKSRFSFGGLNGPKYYGTREKAFDKYVRDAKLSSAKIDLVITAVNESFPTQTHCFTSFEAKRDHDKDVTVLDAIMASSAAPTYFPSHMINGISFIDGGMQANNPAKVAYDIAKRIQSDPVRIWSLGTGDFVSHDQSFNPFRSSLYWAFNAYEVTVANQQDSIDKSLFPVLGENYNRWQVWFNQRIAMDSYGENDLKFLLEYARQFVEEADASDANPINRCVEALLSNRGKS